MLALDLDGTTLRSSQELSMAVIRAVIAATEKGVKVVLASARPPRSVREIYQHFALDTPQVNYNGAVIWDQVRRRALHHLPMEPKLARKIIKAARRTDRNVVVSLEILDKWYTDHVDETLPTQTSRLFSPDFVGPLKAFWHVPVTKLMLHAPPARMQVIHAAMKRKFEGKVAMTVSDEHLLQIASLGVDKAPALKRIADSFGIAPRNIMAIGDAPNDLGMLRWVGFAVCPENAWPEVKREVDVIVSRNDDDGVTEAIDAFILKRGN